MCVILCIEKGKPLKQTLLNAELTNRDGGGEAWIGRACFEQPPGGRLEGGAGNDRLIGGRLESSGPFGSMCTHRVQLTDPTQVDEELIGLIREAYEEAG